MTNTDTPIQNLKFNIQNKKRETLEQMALKNLWSVALSSEQAWFCTNVDGPQLPNDKTKVDRSIVRCSGT